MNLIHGTWIPDDTTEFAQSGAFYLWVETDACAHQRRVDCAVPRHPRQLDNQDLEVFLDQKLGIRGTYSEPVAQSLSWKYFLLPTSARTPLPAFELARYVDTEFPDEADLTWWQVCCYRVPNVLATLSDIRFVALHAANDFQLGADLAFWCQFAGVIKDVIAKDQYIPLLQYRALTTSTAGPRASSKPFAIHPSWGFVSEAYESAIQQHVPAMPLACVAGSSSHDEPLLFEREPLLRHFSECLLRKAVTETPFTAKFDQSITGTLLYDCVHPDRSSTRSLAQEEALAEYEQWASWRQNLTRVQTDAGFRLCFRLEEAPADDVDNWRIHFLVAAKHDPSLQIRLDDYWRLGAKDRAQATRLFGSDVEKHLLLALGHAARIYPKVWDGLDTSQPTGITLTLDEAFAFLNDSAWTLDAAGFTVMIPSWWTPQGRRRAKVRLKTGLRPSKATTSKTGYFSLDQIVAYQYELAIGDQAVTEEEWRQLIEAKTPLVQFRGQWMELNRDKMRQLLEFWQTHRNEASDLTIQDILKVATDVDDDVEWEHDKAIQEMLATLQDKSAFTMIEDPANLHGTLRDYQKRGVAWLRYLESLGLHPCLADDMGLGKTLEVIAHLVAEKNEQDGIAPTLVIAPTSVLSNWRKEIERFAPQLRTLVHHGTARIRSEAEFTQIYQEHDVVLTSFALARLDDKILRSVHWHRIVIDEAQNIKNPSAAQTRAIVKLRSQHRMALSGTPVENRLLDLWSIFNFLNPGYLGKEAQFRKTFEVPIQKENDVARQTKLQRLVEPFILRRVKTDPRIIDDLPEKVDQKLYCNLTSEQASLYGAVVKDVTQQLEQADGIQRKGLILATLTKLKQICNHPAHFLQDSSAFTTERSHKLQRLSEMLEEVIDNGESVLVFSQFAEIGSALQDYVTRTLHRNAYFLHGGTSAAKREQMITTFQDPETEPSVFILSLRAGGVGLNLTKANHVFHFDRWWNPAVEDQATDRAFRIGQRKNVFVHKFIAVGTVEERIDQMIEDKKRLSSTIIGADEAWLTELDNETFKDLIALQRNAVLD